MPAPLDFYFDTASFYRYFASMKIEALAAKCGRTVNWRAFPLGAAYKADHELEPLTLPMKGVYIERSARFYGIAYRYPSRFPISGVVPERAFYWTHDRDPAPAKKLAQAHYHAYFVLDRDISQQDVTADVTATLGVKRDEALAALNDVAVKTRFREEVDTAIKRGVFGSPYVMVDGEPFWGVDRFDQIERWLAHGPF